MANCEFAGGIKNVRGTLSKKVIFDRGEKITRIVTASVRGGKQRVYIRDIRQRTTPISEREKCARTQFAAANTYWLSLTDEQKKTYQSEWKRSNYKFNGKKYATLRGYVIARFYAGQTLVNP